MMIGVSVIIVNWNGEQFIRDCFYSLKAQTFKDFEVIFMDNASADDSVPLAHRLASETDLPIKIIELPINTGFTGGNIEGLKHCSGRYIALLNNDTAANDRWLEALVRAMNAHLEVGICASKLIVAGTEIIDSAGDCYSTTLHGFKRGEGLPSSIFDKEEYVFGACAGAALYRKEMIDQIGFLDDDFFLIFEDVDLSFRAQLTGWKCLYVPESIVHHKVSAGIKKLGALSTECAVRNERIVIVKNVPTALLLLHLPRFIFEELFFSIFYHISIGRFRSYLKGNIAFLKSLPRHLKKRRQIQKMRQITNQEIRSLLSPVWPMYKRKIKAKLGFPDGAKP
jgi:GT2 family glycosyltransferase